MTETLTEQPTAAALQSRTAAVQTFPEAVVLSRPDGFREGAVRPVYVTEARDDSPTANVGTIMDLEPAPSGNGWLNRRPNGSTEEPSFHRYHGAVVNPAPVNGHYYRSLADDQFLVRFNDEDHAEDRGSAAHPWTLLRAAGTTTWPVPNDGLGGMTLFPYVEVSFDEAEVTVPAAEETAVRTAEAEEEEVIEVPAVATIGNEVTGPTRGKAHVEADGTVLLDPEMVKGGMYLLWPEGGDYSSDYASTYLVAFAGGDTTRALDFIPYGYYDWNRSREQLRWVSDYYSLYSTEGMHWAKAALVKPEPGDDDLTVTVHEQLLESEREEFVEFNDKANQIARNAGWCEEYDRIVTSVGMKGRFKRYSFDLSVSFSFENDSPSSAVDTAVANEFGLDSSLSLNTIRYTGTIDVTILVENQPDRESAENYLDSSEIADHISRGATGISDIEIEDWSITDWESLDGDDEDED